MAKDEQIHLRCTKEQKEQVKDILKSLNKKSDFIITYFLDNFLNTTPQGLKIQLYNLEKELKQKEQEQENNNKDIETLNIKIQAIKENLNNKNLFDKEFYKDQENIINAIQGVKNYYLRKKHLIQSINDIPKDVIKDVAKQNNLSEKDLYNFVSNDFINW